VLNQKAALEEEALNAKYGAAYAAYEDKVRPKFFPFLF
jgi:protein-S-isoprenylcysteine O-methyltransferase Ste14